MMVFYHREEIQKQKCHEERYFSESILCFFEMKASKKTDTSQLNNFCCLLLLVSFCILSLKRSFWQCVLSLLWQTVLSNELYRVHSKDGVSQHIFLIALSTHSKTKIWIFLQNFHESWSLIYIGIFFIASFKLLGYTWVIAFAETLKNSWPFPVP